MKFSRKQRTSLEVSLTPMIDVVFLLLIFFMVTTTFNQQSSIKINLPEASSEEAESEKKIIMLIINAEGLYFIADEGEGETHQLINNKPETLKRALIRAAGQSRTIPFVISADGNTPHQAVVTAIDVAAQLGFSRVTFATKTIPES